MLPRDSKRRKQDAESLKESQQQLDLHLRERDAAIPYSDAHFCEAAIEWLVATDQVRYQIRFHFQQPRS